jgi:hypothetical protein
MNLIKSLKFNQNYHCQLCEFNLILIKRILLKIYKIYHIFIQKFIL